MFFQFNPVQLDLGAPGVYLSFLSPDLDKGSPIGCLRWSPTGGEVTHMCHTLRGGCEPLMAAPVLCSGCSRWF